MSAADPSSDLAWVAPYLRPDAVVDGAGNYNRNFIVQRGAETLVVRVPIAEAAALDFRVLPEAQVLPVIEAAGFPAPRLLHADAGGRFALHSYIPGTRLDALYPVRAALPDWVALDMAAQLARLHAIDPAPLIPFCAALPAVPNSAALLATIIAFTERSLTPLTKRYAWLYAQLHVPPDPLAAVRALAKELPPASFTICHCDVHRRNLIAGTDHQTLTIIDWELALVGDPALDLGIHLHRMRYQPQQEDLFLATYLGLRDAADEVAHWRERLAIYRRHEQVRSALVDVTRTVEDLREDLPPATRRMLVEHYALKLQRAWQIWGAPPDPALARTDALLALLEEAGARVAR